MKQVMILGLVMTSLFSLTTAFAQSSDPTQAICKVTASTEAGPLGSKIVTVDLKQVGSRYLEGSQSFQLFKNDALNTISIQTWDSKAGQASDNTINIEGVQLSNAGMNTSIKTDSFSFSVNCSLK